MKNIFYFLILAVGCIPMSAQSTLTGYIVENGTLEPVEFATVYINGTTSGTVTDEKGYFELKSPKTYPIQLVVSHLSYESGVFPLDEFQEDPITLAIESRSLDLQEVEVEDKNKRAKNMAEFLPEFLGYDFFGERATLTNPDAIFFNRDYIERELPGYLKGTGPKAYPVSEDGVVTLPLNLLARSTQQLLIEQPLTGYTIHCDLHHFQLNYNRGSQIRGTSTLGTYYFEPHEVKSKRKQKRIQLARLKAYFHSQQHFLYALYHQKLSEDGYLIFEKVPDSTGAMIYQPFPLLDYLRSTPDDNRAIQGLKDQTLQIFYYERGVPEPDESIIKGNPEISMIKFKDDICVFRANGTAPDANIQFGGVIAEKKVGAMLPDDFNPESL